MAYENYLFVSWTAGTPITGARLAQMSTNIEQVKDVVNDKATGIIKLKQIVTPSPTTGSYSDNAEHEIIFLSNEGANGDFTVSIDANRYYKITLNIPTISVLNAGGEDSKYTINLYSGLGLSNSPTKLAIWEFTPPPYTYINVAGGAANIANEVLKTTTYPTKIGGGTYTFVSKTTTSLTNQTFFATVGRTVGASSNNQPGWRVDANGTAPIQLYVEDAGGI